MTKHVALRLPDELADAIDARAAEVGMSRNAWIVAALELRIQEPVTTRVREERI